jgi:glyoxylase I family protein
VRGVSRRHTEQQTRTSGPRKGVNVADPRAPSSTSELANMPPLMQCHHVGLTVTDVERSEAWYHDVLGFERLLVEPHHGADGYAVVMTRPGTSLFIGLDYHASNEGERFVEHRTGLDHLAMSVPAREHLDRWVEHLDRLGIAHSEINDRAEPLPGATLIMRDPDNIQIEFMWA